MNLVIGIDEVGRGPLAGPVTLCAFMTHEKTGRWILKNLFKGKLRDSKKLSEKQRIAMHRYFVELKKEGKVDFKVVHVSNKIIDKIGIQKSIQKGIYKILEMFASSKNISSEKSSGRSYRLNQTFSSESFFQSEIKLDGGLKAPEKFLNQKTIIKGDEKDVFIACASIVAKVSRDRLMCRMAKKYPEYGFEIHKGYGTKLHRKLLGRVGLSSLHRISFCANVKTW